MVLWPGIEGEAIVGIGEAQTHPQGKRCSQGQVDEQKEELKCKLRQALVEREEADRGADEEIEGLQKEVQFRLMECQLGYRDSTYGEAAWYPLMMRSSL